MNINKASNHLEQLRFNLENNGIYIDVVWFRAEKMEQGRVIKRHMHSSYEIHMVKSGECKIITDKQTVICSKNDTYITPPYVHHEQITTSKEPYIEYCLNFDIELKDCNNPDSEILFRKCEELVFSVIPDTKEIIKLFEQALKEAENKKFGYYQTIEHIIFMLIIKIIRLANANEEDRNYIVNHNRDDLRFMKINRFIMDNLCEPISISDIAAHMCLSEKQINRIVQKKMHCSLKHYINSLRLEYARERLLHSDKPLNSIAEEMGFSSVQYFSSWFKKLDRHSPSTLRKNS